SEPPGGAGVTTGPTGGATELVIEKSVLVPKFVIAKMCYVLLDCLGMSGYTVVMYRIIEEVCRAKL
ncbi:MAG: hypothetical protein KAX26_00860, partial [Anaerolineae bacterium]|nr:hypothetical protein [Anaerolineae bacterium]